ncbi:MAG: GNAT superfamily N-acetyltransferase [Pseudorhodobacter sp.]|jgi:GNAT superfamily N-acetyltransferase
MQDIAIMRVVQAQIPLLDAALRQLAADLGDTYSTDQMSLEAALCRPGIGCFALLASRNETPVGAVLAAPVFSTTRGGAGLFVTDLWVAQTVRGQGLARRLLAKTLQEGLRRNSGHFLKLAVYHDNPRARAAYDRMGFVAAADETNMVLTGTSLELLKETA